MVDLGAGLDPGLLDLARNCRPWPWPARSEPGTQTCIGANVRIGRDERAFQVTEKAWMTSRRRRSSLRGRRTLAAPRPYPARSSVSYEKKTVSGAIETSRPQALHPLRLALLPDGLGFGELDAIVDAERILVRLTSLATTRKLRLRNLDNVGQIIFPLGVLVADCRPAGRKRVPRRQTAISRPLQNLILKFFVRAIALLANGDEFRPSRSAGRSLPGCRCGSP
jgi:hypothetical protein